MTVLFSPLIDGEINGVLTIHNNDFDEGSATVSVHGEGKIPPDIVVTPDSVTAALLPGEATRTYLTVSNNGGSDLSFFINLSETLETMDSSIVTMSPFKNARGSATVETGQINNEKSLAGGSNGRAEPWNVPFMEGRTAEWKLTAPSAAPDSAEMFTDNFEDGDLAGWINDGGAGTKEVTAEFAANASSNSSVRVLMSVAYSKSE